MGAPQDRMLHPNPFHDTVWHSCFNKKDAQPHLGISNPRSCTDSLLCKSPMQKGSVCKHISFLYRCFFKKMLFRSKIFFYILSILFASCSYVFSHIHFPSYGEPPVALVTTRISQFPPWIFYFSFIFFCVCSFFPLWDSYVPPDGFHLSKSHSQCSSLQFFPSHPSSFFHLFHLFAIPSTTQAEEIIDDDEMPMRRWWWWWDDNEEETKRRRWWDDHDDETTRMMRLPWG